MALPTARTASPTLGLVALLAFTAAVYTWRLDRAPIYAAPDEAHFAAHASALAEHGTDLHGNRRPVFFRITDPLIAGHDMGVWYQPFLFYTLAAGFSFLPVNEWSARLPVAAIGVVNVALMFFVGRRLFRSNVWAWCAAATLAMTPAHFLFSRQAVDYLCPLPFVLGWLWAMLAYDDTRRPRYWIAAMMILGAGVFTYISSWAVMPLFAVLTYLIVRPPLRIAALGAVAFVIPIAVVLPWQSGLSAVLGDVITRYRIGGSVDAAPGPVTTLLDANLAERVSLFWNYFNPSFLFFAGGSDLMMATSRAGVFLLSLVVLIPLGVFALWQERSRASLLLLIGLAVSPLPVVITLPEVPDWSIGRALTVIVFGVLIAIAGARWLWQGGSVGRTAAVMLLLAMPIQFAMFDRDYLTGYQERSASRFDPNATRDVMTAILELERQSPVPLVLINDDANNKAIRWKFYTLKHQRPDLWARTQYFRVDALDAAGPPMGSVLVMPANDPRSAKLIAAGCSRIASVQAVGGNPASDIFRRDR